MGSNQSSTDPYIPHAPTESQVRRYTEIIVNLPGKPRMQALDWISQFLSRYDGQSEAQEGLAREVYEYLDYYLQSRNLNRGVLVSFEIQEALLGEGRRQGLHSREGGGDERSDRLAYTPETTSTTHEDDQGDINELEVTDPAASSEVGAPNRDDQGSNDLAQDEQSMMFAKSESLSPEDHRGQKRKAEEELPTKPTLLKEKACVKKLAELHDTLLEAKTRDADAKTLSRRRTRRAVAFRNLAPDRQLAKLEEDWKRVQEQRHRDGISYEAILEKLETETMVLPKDTDVDEQADSE